MANKQNYLEEDPEEVIRRLTAYAEEDGFFRISDRLVLKRPVEAADDGNFTLCEIAENGGTLNVISMTKDEVFELFYMLRGY